MSEQELVVYYNYLYPFETLVRWLTYNKRTQLAHRELSFEYEGVGVERYVTFTDAAAMKARMISRFSKVPLKVDAGAIWNQIPQKDSNGRTLERELIFDFDMNDYDDVRTCCSGKNVCVKCWKLLIVAVQVIEAALQQDFGFKQLMFVFSGGRGLHIWVCDKRARELKDSVRKAVVDYLQLVTGNEKAASLLSDRVIAQHEDNKMWRGKVRDNATREEIREFLLRNQTSTHVERSLEILGKHFIGIMEEQKVFAEALPNEEKRLFQNQKCIDIMLKIIATRNDKLKENVWQRWVRLRGRGGAQEFMAALQEELKRFESCQTVGDYLGNRMGDRIYRLTFIEEEIMLSFLYPRMDYNVSTMQNHLLKLPFSVHPSSRRISIPLFKRQLESFDPKKCVTIKDLLKTVEEYANQGLLEGRENEAIAKTTLLREPIEAMEQFISTLQ